MRKGRPCLTVWMSLTNTVFREGSRVPKSPGGVTQIRLLQTRIHSRGQRRERSFSGKDGFGDRGSGELLGCWSFSASHSGWKFYWRSLCENSPSSTLHDVWVFCRHVLFQERHSLPVTEHLKDRRMWTSRKILHVSGRRLNPMKC